MSPAVRDIFADWTVPLWLTASILITGAIYIRGWLAIRRTRPRLFTIDQLGFFLSGLIVLWLAIGSPMDGFADALLGAHMIEHLLLMSIVPPLLLFGRPAVPLLRGMPLPVLRYVTFPLLRRPRVRRLFHWLMTPVVAWFILNISFVGWHFPGAYNFALLHENWHDCEHACFLFSSILFWWCIIRPWPAKSQDQTWTIILCLAGAALVNTIVAGSLVFSSHPVYSYYVTHPNPFGLDPLSDQMLGAAIMWVVGSIIYLAPVMVLTYQLVGGAPGSRTAPTTLKPTALTSNREPPAAKLGQHISPKSFGEA